MFYGSQCFSCKAHPALPLIGLCLSAFYADTHSVCRKPWRLCGPGTLCLIHPLIHHLFSKEQGIKFQKSSTNRHLFPTAKISDRFWWPLKPVGQQELSLVRATESLFTTVPLRRMSNLRRSGSRPCRRPNMLMCLPGKLQPINKRAVKKTEVDATQPLRLTQTAYVQLCKSNQWRLLIRGRVGLGLARKAVGFIIMKQAQVLKKMSNETDTTQFSSWLRASPLFTTHLSVFTTPPLSSSLFLRLVHLSRSSYFSSVGAETATLVRLVGSIWQSGATVVGVRGLWCLRQQEKKALREIVWPVTVTHSSTHALFESQVTALFLMKFMVMRTSISLFFLSLLQKARCLSHIGL